MQRSLTGHNNAPLQCHSGALLWPVNDRCPCNVKSHILKFADDTEILKNITNISDYNELQEDSENLIRWSQHWQMLFSVDKCKVMYFEMRCLITT